MNIRSSLHNHYLYKNFQKVIYPDNFELKTGIDKIRARVCSYCMYEPGRKEVMKLEFQTDPESIRLRLREVDEFKSIIASEKEFPVENFIDISNPLKKLKTQGRYLEEEELFSIKKLLDSIRAVLSFFKKDEEDAYPALKAMAEEVKFFPVVTDRLNSLMNKHGRIKDNASRELQDIRRELHSLEGSINKKLNRILAKAVREGLVDEDTSLAVRNGRTVIPVPSSNKRLIGGYVHDESATGKTAYVEPAEIVEANNGIRELEMREKREIIKILTEVTDFLRPYEEDLFHSHSFLAKIDSVRARAKFANSINAVFPRINNNPEVDWVNAIHPVLLLSFRESGREGEVVPLNLKLDKENRILLISGPNAGGKSVCLQTLGILQYMLQCGFLVPVSDRSNFGIFENIFLDLGDEQSIEDDLSTYSSHLLNMKYFAKNADERSLILIDEFGSGTEPTLGAAIAESVLESLNAAGVFGLITTHYTNLKHYASAQPGLINGAMLYDTGRMQALFKLVIGRPGSSFAFEIARKIGLPESILKSAEEKIGREQVDFDKALKDLIRDKKYWENKRQRIRVSEKKLSELVERYDSEFSDTEKIRKKIIKEAKEQAESLLAGANKKIENTIREIREAEAEKEKTRKVRKNLEEYKKEVDNIENNIDRKKSEAEDLKNKIRKMKARNEQIRKRDSLPKKKKPETKLQDTAIVVGDLVKMEGQDVNGEVLEIKGKNAFVAFGHLKTRVKLELLRKQIPSNKREGPKAKIKLGEWDVGKRRLRFSPEIDIRGKRADEALGIIAEFIDEAIMVQVHDLRILHGKGNGILRELIRQQLSAMDVVESFGDEHVERGGAGITVLKLST